MRRWLAAAGAGLRVADRAALWPSGALAWVAGAGWIPFVAAVAPPPTQSGLTHFGAGLLTSGLWPLNLVLIVAGAILLFLTALALWAVGNAALVGAVEGRRTGAADALRLFGVALAVSLPVALGAATILVGVAAVAPVEFTRPGTDVDPMVRTLGRLAPLAAFTAAMLIAGTALAAVAGRLAIRRGSAFAALAAAPAAAWRLGVAGLAQVVISLAVGLAYLAVATLLLRVLWAPLAVRLPSDALGRPDTWLLLVGFVAIWLCLVLGGGAVHAWAAATWSRLLDGTMEDAWRS